MGKGKRAPKDPAAAADKAVREARALVADVQALEVEKRLVAGKSVHKIAEELKIDLVEVYRLVVLARASIKRHRKHLAEIDLDLRMARLDRVVAAFDADLDDKKPTVRGHAADQIRETELTRAKILVGEARVKRTDHDIKLAKLHAGDTGAGVPKATVRFVERGAERPDHVEPPPVGDDDDDE